MDQGILYPKSYKFRYNHARLSRFGQPAKPQKIFSRSVDSVSGKTTIVDGVP
jgi:hypothetical protein